MRPPRCPTLAGFVPSSPLDHCSQEVIGSLCLNDHTLACGEMVARFPPSSIVATNLCHAAPPPSADRDPSHRSARLLAEQVRQVLRPEALERKPRGSLRMLHRAFGNL